MSPRRKPTTEHECIHTCEQLESLGEINARLDGQEKTDERIEKALIDLIAQNTSERTESVKEFGKIRSELTKLSTVIEASNKNTEAVIANQNKMIEHLAEVSSTTKRLGDKQETFQETMDRYSKAMEKHVEESNRRYKDIDKKHSELEKRIMKLEHSRHMWYVIGTAILAIIAAAGSLASIIGILTESQERKAQHESMMALHEDVSAIKDNTEQK